MTIVKAMAAPQSTVPVHHGDEDDDEYDIPEQLEDILHHLLTFLKDKDTIVRLGEQTCLRVCVCVSVCLCVIMHTCSYVPAHCT